MKKSTIKLLVTIAVAILAALLIGSIASGFKPNDTPGTSGGGTADMSCQHTILYSSYTPQNDEVHNVTKRCVDCMEIIVEKQSENHRYSGSVCSDCENVCGHSGADSNGVCYSCRSEVDVFVIGVNRYVVNKNLTWGDAIREYSISTLSFSDNLVYWNSPETNLLYDVSTQKYVQASDFIKHGGVYAFCSHNYEKNCVDLLDGRNHSIVTQCTICKHISFSSSSTAHIYYDNDEGVCSGCGYVCEHIARNNSYVSTSTSHSLCEKCSYCKTVIDGTVQSSADHVWNNGVCNICGYECLHNINITDGVCTVCDWECSHKWNLVGQCTICGYECKHPSDNQQYVYEDLGNGTHKEGWTRCTICGANQVWEVKTHTLVSCDDDCDSKDYNGHTRHVKCQYCSYESTHVEAHVFEYNVKDKTTHTKTCTICGYSEIETHSAFIEYVYDVWQCPDCGYTCESHEYIGGICGICGRLYDY